MKKHMGSEGILTFGFLFSGSIIYKPYYPWGNPVVSYLFITAFLVVFSAVGMCFLRKSTRLFSKPASIAIAVSVVPALALMPGEFVKSLASFADYYSYTHVELFALGAVIFAGAIMALKGKKALNGFARMTAVLCAVWILSGAAGFFYTKTIAPQTAALCVNDYPALFRTAAIFSLDTVLLQYVLLDGVEEKEEKIVKRRFFGGVVAFFAVSGGNLLKNILMFGDRFIAYVDNPDLAAIRLIPAFELPEISVVVNTIAVALRIGVYLYAVARIIGRAFEKSVGTTCAVIYCSACAVVSLISVFADGFAQLCLNAGAAGITVCAVIMLFFGKSKKQKSGDGM